jgi:hypothetical protein
MPDGQSARPGAPTRGISAGRNRHNRPTRERRYHRSHALTYPGSSVPAPADMVSAGLDSARPDITSDAADTTVPPDIRT